jgi:hypothetical protein
LTRDFLGDDERRALRAEIAAHGLEADPFVVPGPWVRTWGLNLAVGWPLPVDPAAYHRRAGELAALDPGLFVYPHRQTHVTVLTLVSFKEHVEPSLEQTRALEDLIPLVSAAVAPVAGELGAFALELGAPVLARRAVFIPIRDREGAVARFRAAVLPALRALSPLFQRCQPPRAVHATLARFRAAPGPDFAPRFAAWSAGGALGAARVTSIQLTTETQPYMREGQVVGLFPLAPMPR